MQVFISLAISTIILLKANRKMRILIALFALAGHIYHMLSYGLQLVRGETMRIQGQSA